MKKKGRFELSTHKILIINNSFLPVRIIFGGENGIYFAVKENPPKKYPNNIIFIIEQFFKAFRIEPTEITEIAVVVGPGSFTGTRISVVEGKILAYALKVPLIPLNSLDIIGKGVKEGYAAIFAGRKEIFAAKFENGERKTEDMCLPFDEAENMENLFFPSKEEARKSKLNNAKITEIPDTALLELALKKAESKEFVKDPLSVNPVYLRSTDVIFKKKKK